MLLPPSGIKASHARGDNWGGKFLGILVMGVYRVKRSAGSVSQVYIVRVVWVTVCNVKASYVFCVCR